MVDLREASWRGEGAIVEVEVVVVVVVVVAVVMRRERAVAGTCSCDGKQGQR